MQPIRNILLTISIGMVGLSGLVAAEGPVTAPSGATPAPPTPPPTVSIAAALEAVTDEDPVTRAAGQARLNACTAADRTALEQAAQSTDLAIREHAVRLLAQINRGEIVVMVRYAEWHHF